MMKLQLLSILALILLTVQSLAHSAPQFSIDNQPVFHNGKQVLEANDAGEVVYDQSATGMSPIDHKYFHFRRSFEDVTSYLTSEVEGEFDVFVMVNIKFQNFGSANDVIPAQHMVVLRKAHPGQKIFVRDDQGEILDVAAGVLGTRPDLPAIPTAPGQPSLPIVMPVSSGASHRVPTPENPQPYVDTFSGMFRVNYDKSTHKRFQKGMFDALYVDIAYPWGKASGIAIHGTTPGNVDYLGTQQSHGCVRTSREYSTPIYEYIMSPAMTEPNLRDFDRKERLGPLLKQTRLGQKALMIFFYGSDGDEGLDT